LKGSLIAIAHAGQFDVAVSWYI
jgi:hypothetical protein